MDILENHKHKFNTNKWPFLDPENSAVISTRQVIKFGFPILRVCHDIDGDWQILCGTTNDVNDGLVVCFGCAFESDSTIGELFDLPLGWVAWRENIKSKWNRAFNERTDEEDYE